MSFSLKGWHLCKLEIFLVNNELIKLFCGDSFVAEKIVAGLMCHSHSAVLSFFKSNCCSVCKAFIPLLSVCLKM